MTNAAGPPEPPPHPIADDPTAVVGARVGQHLLDSVLLFVFALVVMGVAGLIAMLLHQSARNQVAGIVAGVVIGLALLLALAGSWLLNAWWPHRHAGQTPAMGWLKLRIVDQAGGPPGLKALTIRWVLLIIDTLCSGLVGLVVMLVNPRHQRVGDMAAGTLVVRAGT